MKRRVFLSRPSHSSASWPSRWRDLAALRQSYGFETVRPCPLCALRACTSTPPSCMRSSRTQPAIGACACLACWAAAALDLPSDPLVQNVDPKTKLPYEWQFASANLGSALDLTAGDPRIQVGVVDTGVDAVPDLAGKIDALYDVTAQGTKRSASTAGNDDYGHGTAVASLIAAGVGDGFGMAGFGGAAHVIGIHADSQGRFYDTDIAQAIAKLDALGVRIVNLSIGGPYPSSPILVDAIDKAAADGMLIVAASGNEGGPVDWPAALLQQSGGGESYGLAVGATNAGGNHASFSNFGKHLSLVAPGIFTGDCSGVLVALPRRNQLSDTCYPQWTGSGGTEYGYVAGTSFASPEVAGVAALVWAARPELKNYQVADIIKASADRDAGAGWTPTLGCGRLDAAAAVALALSRTAAEWASGAPSGRAPAPPKASRLPPCLIPRRSRSSPFRTGRRQTATSTRTHTRRRACRSLHGLRRLHHASRRCPRDRRQPVLDHRIPERQRRHLPRSPCAAGRRDHRCGDSEGSAGRGHCGRACEPALPLDDARNRRDGRMVERNGKAIARVQPRTLPSSTSAPLLRRVARAARGGARSLSLLRHAAEPDARRTRAALHELRSDSPTCS